MNSNSQYPSSPTPIGTPTLIDLDDVTHSPMFVARSPDELWLLSVPTRHILSLLEIPLLDKETKDPALAELARPGVQPPESLR